MVVGLAALPLLGTAAFLLPGTLRRLDVKIGIALLIAAAILPLLYAIPLSPTLWTSLPGRKLAVDTYKATGIAIPWHGAGLVGGRSLPAALHVIPVLAMFLGFACLPAARRWQAVYVLLAFVVVGVFIGLAQIFGGQQSALRFYDITSLGGGVGFFANRNHQATLMLMSMPLALAAAVSFAGRGNARSRAAMTVCLVVFALTIIGLAAALSRAGILLSIPVLLGSGLVAFTSLKSRKARLWIAGGLIAGLVIGGALAVHSSGMAIADRLSGGIVDEDRQDFAVLTKKAAADFAPVGSGPGTFEAIFPIYEPVEEIRPLYVNHAHNEYLEIWLEYGILGIVGVAASILWLLWMIMRAWWPDGRGSDRVLAKAASIGIVAVLAHSFVDYPLRTSTIAVLIGMAGALLLEAPRGPERNSKGRRRKSAR